MKTLVFFQLDLIRRANYPTFHEHLYKLFGGNTDNFIRDSLPSVNAYKQAQITQEKLFDQLAVIAKSYKVEMDQNAIKTMWATLHPNPETLIADICSAIKYSKIGFEVMILSYHSQFATEDFQSVLRGHQISFKETDFGICIDDKIEIHFSHRALDCGSPDQFFKTKFQHIKTWSAAQSEKIQCVYLPMDVSQLPALHQADLGEREAMCLGFCRSLNYTVAEYKHVPGKLELYFTSEVPLVPELVEQRAKEMPDKLAVSFEKETLSYAELNAKANQLAHYLRKKGVGPEKLVAVYLDRGINLIVSLLGILKAGGAYIPINPRYPAARVKSILASSDDIIAVISEENLMSRLNETLSDSGKQLIAIDRDWAIISKESNETPKKITHAKNLAYVIYTSGSTGVPKGVLIEMHSLLNLMTWYKKTYAITPADRFSLSVGVAFVVAAREIWSCLTAGASLHIVKPGMESDLDSLLAFFRRENISITYLPTPLVEILLRRSPEPIDHLTRVLTGGSKLKVYPTSATPFKLYNHYGTTETAATVTQTEVVPVDSGKPSISLIGRPIANQYLYVLNDSHQPVSNGEIGELCVSGEGVARGYLNLPELTTQSFIPSPFLPGERLYKTGDRVRRLLNGTLEFIGRNDSQVKIRGMRVELGEIETALDNHDMTSQAVVMAKEGQDGEATLVAYLTNKKGITKGEEAATLIETLRTFLHANLPDYMVPSAFILLDSFPVNASGKIDRLALGAFDISKAIIAAAGPGQLPNTPLEIKLAAIWKEYLGLSNIGVNHHFQTLGGNSLTVTMLRERLEKEFTLPITIEHITTIHELAQAIEALQKSSVPTMKSVDDDLAIQFSVKKIVRDERYNITYKMLRMEDISSAAAVIGETFADPIRGEPMTSRLGISVDDMTRVAILFCHLGAEQGLSTVAVNAEGNIIGVSIAFNNATPDPEIEQNLAEKFAPIFVLLEQADKLIPEDLIKNNQPVVHRFIIGIKPGAPSNVAYLLHKLGSELAKQKGFKMSLTEPTGPISQRIVQTYGYTLHSPVLYDKFEYKGKKVFADLSASYNERLLSAGIFNTSVSFFGCPAATRPISPPLIEQFRAEYTL